MAEEQLQHPVDLEKVPGQHRQTYERLLKMKADVEQIPANEAPKKCIEGEFMLYLEYDRALMPGHIYSYEGVKEARISGSCEYHFDRWFKEGWRDPITGAAGSMPAEEEEPDGQ